YAASRPCQRFEAGTKTTYTLKHHDVYVLTNATAWVEARWGGHVHRTPNLTLYLNEAGKCLQGRAGWQHRHRQPRDHLVFTVKPDPPPAGMLFNKTGGRLRLRVPQLPCHRRGQPMQWETRFRRMGDRGWMQVQTPFGRAGGERRDVTCALGGPSAFEVQLRCKPPHWSSYWSNWSSSIFVPEEILASPALSYQLGKLGRDGQRVLRLSWQQAPEEQGEVTYVLRAYMPACRCAEASEEETMVMGTEVTAYNLTLSGAEYEILLTAANAAGTGPAQRLRVPAEQSADLGFKDVSTAGGTVMARWEARSPGFAYCFEQQPLSGASKHGVCIRRDFPAKSIHVERGTGAPRAPTHPSPRRGPALEAPACYRLAVHGWAPARGWSTFALQHYYAGNSSLAVPIHVNTRAGDAAVVLQWSPSPRATCPGALAKYLICHAAKGDNVTYDEADAAASHYTLQNLRPGTVYRVGVQEVTAESGGSCGTWWHFQTKGARGAAWKSNLKYLGVLLGLPAVAALYQLSKTRAHRCLFPPLPKPVGSQAVQFSASEMSQGQPRPDLVEPSERFSPAELLLLELNPSKETTDAGTRPGTPQPGPTAEEPAVECPLGCEKELPLTYRRQEVLSPVGFPPPGSTNCTGRLSGQEEEEEEEEGRQGLSQLLVPIALLISDKPIIIRDEEGWDPSPEKLVP
ncbi:I12R1 protein, partial [Podilymbus podiceps]|nr:I12R1 protein [Podilymbus podiceps]